MRFAKLSLALVCLVGVLGCGNSKALADAALKTAADAYGPVSSEAQKYVPDQAAAVQSAIASAQAAAAKGDYTAAVEQAKGIPSKITDLTAAITAKKAELTKTWTEVSTSVPGLMNALKSRVDMLSKSRGVPAGLTRNIVDQAKSDFAAASQEWAGATAAAQSGDVATAASKAADVKSKVVAIMTSLKMQIPKSAM